ncbi:hypothetical protein DFJ74DRAFT_672689 [Hyaloraphidium curvatum]|nr:hypothetical protein DFJ74DRAFT_672689 [Hyaloraphidium curvatum]
MNACNDAGNKVKESLWSRPRKGHPCPILSRATALSPRRSPNHPPQPSQPSRFCYPSGRAMWSTFGPEYGPSLQHSNPSHSAYPRSADLRFASSPSIGGIGDASESEARACREGRPEALDDLHALLVPRSLLLRVPLLLSLALLRLPRPMQLLPLLLRGLAGLGALPRLVDPRRAVRQALGTPGRDVFRDRPVPRARLGAPDGFVRAPAEIAAVPVGGRACRGQGARVDVEVARVREEELQRFELVEETGEAVGVELPEVAEDPALGYVELAKADVAPIALRDRVHLVPQAVRSRQPPRGTAVGRQLFVEVLPVRIRRAAEGNVPRDLREPPPVERVVLHLGLPLMPQLIVILDILAAAVKRVDLHEEVGPRVAHPPGDSGKRVGRAALQVLRLHKAGENVHGHGSPEIHRQAGQQRGRAVQEREPPHGRRVHFEAVRGDERLERGHRGHVGSDEGGHELHEEREAGH